MLISTFYIFVVLDLKYPFQIKIGMVLAATYIGMHLPLLFLKNKIQKRQLSIKRAFPDALDLLLICVESGMSIEAAFKKVSAEIGSQSIALAEELTLTTAELSYLQDRRMAYENLAKRTDLEGVKSVCVALQQAERYGTPLAQTLRVLAQENRDMRMSEAEKKAAGAAAEADGADDPVLPAGAVHRDSRAGRDPRHVDAVIVARTGRRSASSAFRGVKHRARDTERARLRNYSPPAAARAAPACPSCALLVGEHLPQIIEIGLRLLGREVGARDFLGFLEAALQADHQREILSHARLAAVEGAGAAQGLLGFLQILRQRVGQSEIGHHRRFVRHDAERALVMAARFVVPAHLIEHGALRRENAPVRLIRRMSAAEHVERLAEVSGIGERAAIGAEHDDIVRAVDRGLLQNGHGLRALAGRAQRLRVADRRLGVFLILAIALAPDLGVAPPFHIGAGHLGGNAEPVVPALVSAAGQGQACENGRGRQQAGFVRLGTHDLLQ